MRADARNNILSAHAISGGSIIWLSWEYQIDSLEGKIVAFSLQRLDISSASASEFRWLKCNARRYTPDRFSSRTGAAPVSRPAQSFHYGDYAVREGRQYRYHIVPAIGTPGHHALAPALAVTLDIVAETDVQDDSERTAPRAQRVPLDKPARDAAVHEYRLAGHVARLVRGEKHDHGRDLFRPAESAEWNFV